MPYHTRNSPGERTDHRSVPPSTPELDEPVSETLVLPACRSEGAWLVELGAADASECFELGPGRPVVLGSGRNADVRLADRSVSARHCALSVAEGGVRIEDLGSTNGLHVGAARLGSALLSEDGASFVIGRTSVTVRQKTDDVSREMPRIPGFVGSSLPMRRVAEEIARHARSRQSVLLQGESGTGKDVVARALHALSGRSGEFVPLNVGAFPDSLADAELFGHRRGAYTGAVSNRAGAFEVAHRGTLFLDEVAELSAAAQVKLLRVVEDGAVRIRLAAHKRCRSTCGSSPRVGLPARRARVRDGRSSRVDLSHRLSTVTVTLPPAPAQKERSPRALSRVARAAAR